MNRDQIKEIRFRDWFSRGAGSRLLFLATCCCFRSRDPLCHDFPGCSVNRPFHRDTYAKTVRDCVSGITGYWKKFLLSFLNRYTSNARTRVISAVSFCFKSVTEARWVLSIEIKIYRTERGRTFPLSFLPTLCSPSRVIKPVPRRMFQHLKRFTRRQNGGREKSREERLRCWSKGGSKRGRKIVKPQPPSTVWACAAGPHGSLSRVRSYIKIVVRIHNNGPPGCWLSCRPYSP